MSEKFDGSKIDYRPTRSWSKYTPKSIVMGVISVGVVGTLPVFEYMQYQEAKKHTKLCQQDPRWSESEKVLSEMPHTRRIEFTVIDQKSKKHICVVQK